MIRSLTAALFLSAIAAAILAQTTTPDAAKPVAPVPQLADEAGTAAPAQEGDNAKKVPARAQQVDVQNGAGAPHDTQERRSKTEYYWSIAGSVATVLSSLVLAAVGIFGLLFVKKQLTAMEESNRQTQISNQLAIESNKAARVALIAAHRARVGINHISNDTVIPGVDIQVWVYIINSGAGIARNIRAVLGYSWELGPLPEDFQFVPTEVPAEQKVRGAVSVLHPGASHRYPIVVPAVTEEGIRKIGMGAFRLYVVGKFTYDDEFSEGWVTQFCRLLAPDCQGWLGTPHGERAT